MLYFIHTWGYLRLFFCYYCNSSNKRWIMKRYDRVVIWPFKYLSYFFGEKISEFILIKTGEFWQGSKSTRMLNWLHIGEGWALTTHACLRLSQVRNLCHAFVSFVCMCVCVFVCFGSFICFGVKCEVNLRWSSTHLCLGPGYGIFFLRWRPLVALGWFLLFFLVGFSSLWHIPRFHS